MDKVLSASKIGFPCERNLWYAANGYEGITDERTERIFSVGTQLEPLIVEWLRADGWTVEYNPGSQNAAFEVIVPVNGGMLKGHPDCFISRPDGIKNVLADIKTMNDRAFTYWKRAGTEKSKGQYVKQLHVYAMGAMAAGRDVEHLAIAAVNKNNSEMAIDIFDFDEELAMEIRGKAEKIFSMTMPPEDNSPMENWCCNYCEYAHICRLHEPMKPDVPVQKDIPLTTDKKVIDAMKDLQRARDLSKEAREIEASAKETLDENIRAKGLSGVQGGGLACSITERVSSRFDTTAFKKVHPELVSQFTKQTTSTVYEVKSLGGGEFTEKQNEPVL